MIGEDRKREIGEERKREGRKEVIGEEMEERRDSILLSTPPRL